MSERAELLRNLAETIGDYRTGEIARPTPDHVDRWVSQFEPEVQLPLMRALQHVLGITYLSKDCIVGCFDHLIRHSELTGTDPCAFWHRAHILNIQQNGHSQSELRKLFGQCLERECGIKSPDDCGVDGGAYVYLDDVLFSGNRIRSDLVNWINTDAPAEATIYIVVIAAHSLGQWMCEERLVESAAIAGKRLGFQFHPWQRLENRRAYKDTSDVLWPAVLPEDAALSTYMDDELRFPFEPRTPNSQRRHWIFGSEEGRQLLERELLMAGMRIRSLSLHPSRILRPLGFSQYGLGFGSTVVTYRNCPNNAPLALWWGDPARERSHPLSKWYPLLPRKTYPSEGPFDGSF